MINQEHKTNRIGESKINSQGYKMKIIEYNSSMDVLVEFEDKFKTKVHTRYYQFINGATKNPSIYKLRLGEVNYNTYGSKMKIIEYNSPTDIIVEFQDEYRYKTKTNYGSFKTGSVYNPYSKTVYGVGYIGEGDYNNKNNPKVDKIWQSMIERGYSKKYKNKHPTYEDVEVCKEWHNFQSFAKWYYEFYYEIEDERMELDKDILDKGNKIYCPEKCVFVPKRINNLFTKSNKNRGELPIGIVKKGDKFNAQCTINNNGKRFNKNLGLFDTPEEAFNSYKQFKELYIKNIADLYKNEIPQKLYDAMYNYKVEITD